MDSIFFHPKLVHLPIALAVVMPVIFIGLTVAWWRSWLPARTWVLAVGLQALLLASGIAALRSGGAEEDRVERRVPEAAIEAHEEAAEGFLIAAGGVLALSVITGLLGRKRVGPALAGATAIGSLLVFWMGYKTGQAGGELVYRYGAAAAYTAGPSPGTPAPPAKADDD
jgi:uncharacterized membrane protein